MYEVLITVYVSIATYYQVGIIHCFRRVMLNDKALTVFFGRCPFSLLTACLLILIIAYLWPLTTVLRLLFYKQVQEHLHPPIKKCPRFEDEILFA
jgi:hypothetical protein